MLNTITIMGRFTKDPELRRTQNGTAVTTFTIACDRDFKNEDGTRSTDFIDCVAWRTLAEHITKNFHKGGMSIVKGRLQFRDWTDNDGNKRRNAEILADSIYFAEPKRTATQEENRNALVNRFDELESEEGIPF